MSRSINVAVLLSALVLAPSVAALTLDARDDQQPPGLSQTLHDLFDSGCLEFIDSYDHQVYAGQDGRGYVVFTTTILPPPMWQAVMDPYDIALLVKGDLAALPSPSLGTGDYPGMGFATMRDNCEFKALLDFFNTEQAE